MHFHTHPTMYVRDIQLKVSNLSKSIEFYKNIVGFNVIRQDKKIAHLSANGKTSILTIEQLDEVEPKQLRTTGLYHFAILLPSRKELAKFIHHLMNTRYTLQGASDHIVSEALYLVDPDGNGVEVYCDRSASEWKWSHGEVLMATDRLDIEDILSERNGEEWSGLSNGTVMGHIHLHVSDLKESETFYCNGLGFEVVCCYGTQALFVSSNGYHHHIGLNTWNGVGAPPPSHNSVGLEHFTISFPSEENRQASIERLHKLGASVETEDDNYTVIDPSGNKLLLTI
ncbi:VOC family protein [Bacillus sp. FJAT-45066]|uniref:VOC family protein n=1 Tax=Bacillus sp. FJAT-45066 TaxID=2011010 RepID=UPI000BB89256|nr:VOC family protein [Bacillus sp. FJAT-45066]